MPIQQMLLGAGSSAAVPNYAINFDSTASARLDCAAENTLSLGTDQFTIEFWMYLINGKVSYQRIFQLDGPTVNSYTNNLQIVAVPSTNGTVPNALNTWAYGSGGGDVDLVGTTNLINGWHHIAVVRNSSNTLIQFVDGVNEGSTTSTKNFNPNSGSPRLRFGAYLGNNATLSFEGKISNCRVTIGQALYGPSNFSPPTSALDTTSQGATASNVEFLALNGAATTDKTVGPTITATGSVSVVDGPFPKTYGYSVYFDGSDWLSISDHSDFTFGTSDFTIECWYKANASSGLSNSFDYIFASGWPIQLAHTDNGGSKITFYAKDSDNGGSGTYFIDDLNTGSNSITAGQWYHVAVTRSSSSYRIFLDGVLKDTQTSSTSSPAPGMATEIGRFPESPHYYAAGTISNFRYIKGTALYTSGFTAPTAPLTAITNTKLLCCNTQGSATGGTHSMSSITNNGAVATSANPF